MNILKGFVQIQSLISNAPGITSPIGEISTWSLTFTRERGEYRSLAQPGYQLVSIRSYDDQTGPVEANVDLAEQTISVVRSFYSYSAGRTLPLSVQDLYDTVVAEYHSKIYNLQFGPLEDNGRIALPQWVSFESLTVPGSIVKVWLSDDAFSNQFDEYEITPVTPLDNLDDFFLLPNAVKVKVEALSITQLMEKVQDSKEHNPETYVRTYAFNYVNPDLPTMTFPTYWSVLIYGEQGDNIDSIKDALIEYVLENSSHSRAEWERVLPSLFKRTEFILMPRWDKYSVPNMTVKSGLYSSIVEVNDLLSFALGNLTYYPPSHVNQYLSIFPYPYKAIMVEACSGPDNVDGMFRLTDHFPDFIPVPSTSLDFNRMGESTKKWSILIERMLIEAEKATDYTSLPRDMRKIHREGKLYISSLFENVQYLVLTKNSTEDNGV